MKVPELIVTIAHGAMKPAMAHSSRPIARAVFFFKVLPRAAAYFSQ
jgi:hypothetical protein